MVIIDLNLGFTNKEIANRLNLSEHTVKEHLKRMMQKTQTTSRTGLLSCMIFPCPNEVDHSRRLSLRKFLVSRLSGHPRSSSLSDRQYAPVMQRPVLDCLAVVSSLSKRLNHFALHPI